MMTATQVFGKRAGQAAARSGKRARRSAFPEVGFNDYVGSSAFLSACNVSRKVPDIERKIKELMSKYLMVSRSEAGLNRCIDELLDCEAQLKELQLKGAIPALQHLELRNMIAAGRIISTAALLRKESSGTHYREDFHG